MRNLQLAWVIALGSITGLSGYYFGSTKEQPVSKMSANDFVALEYLVSPESFSEVERATAVLDALADRYIEQARRWMVLDRKRRNSAPTGVPAPNPVAAAIELLGEAMAEFRGSRQELRLLQPLLCALEHQGLYDRWLDTYLDVLHRHPTSGSLLELRNEAIRMAHAVNRERELHVEMMRMTGLSRSARLRHPIDWGTPGPGPQPHRVGT